MVSLVSGLAANHPAMGQCQIERLRGAGVPEHQIDSVIEIARHIRDEAASGAGFIGLRPNITKCDFKPAADSYSHVGGINLIAVVAEVISYI